MNLSSCYAGRHYAFQGTAPKPAPADTSSLSRYTTVYQAFHIKIPLAAFMAPKLATCATS